MGAPRPPGGLLRDCLLTGVLALVLYLSLWIAAWTSVQNDNARA